MRVGGGRAVEQCYVQSIHSKATCTLHAQDPSISFPDQHTGTEREAGHVKHVTDLLTAGVN